MFRSGYDPCENNRNATIWLAFNLLTAKQEGLKDGVGFQIAPILTDLALRKRQNLPELEMIID